MIILKGYGVGEEGLGYAKEGCGLKSTSEGCNV